MKHLMTLVFALTSAFAGSAVASETVEGAKKDFAAAKAEIAAQLEALDKKIDELKASAAANSTAAKEKSLKEVQETRAKLRADFERAKNATDSNWTLFKRKLARGIDKLNAKTQKALNE